MKQFIFLLIAGMIISCTATLDDADKNGDGILTPKEQQDAGISINIENNNTILILDDRQALDNLTLFNTANSESGSTSESSSESNATTIDNSTDNKTSDNSSS